MATMVSTDYYEFRTFRDIPTIVAESKRLGSHFFSPNAMKFFNSRVHSDLYGGRFFVTSEQNGWGNPRRYTVRMVAVYHNRGTEQFSLDSVGHDGFMGYASRSGAHSAAQRFAANIKAGVLHPADLFRS